MKAITLLLVIGLCAGAGAQDVLVQAPPPQGQVLFQSHPDKPAEAAAEKPAAPTGPELTDAERSAVTVAGYDLDARVTLATGELAMRARVTVRNVGVKPLDRVALQISSSMQWESATLAATRLPLVQHVLDNDADHTGKASEAIVTLPAALEPGKSVVLDMFYSGKVDADGGRLERIGATHTQALATDWDVIDSGGVALRGFGDVLWYPVASPQVFLGEGAQLFDAIGAMKLRQAASMIHLRVAIAYRGDPPVAAYFCGRRQALAAVSDDEGLPIADGAGIATAEFGAEPLGFRVPSLFTVQRPETLIAPLPLMLEMSKQASSSSNPSSETAAHGDSMIEVETSDDAGLTTLATAAQNVSPMLEEWLGEQPLSALTVIDHPDQAFEDGPLLVAPLGALGAVEARQAVVHSLTHAWVQTGQPWMDEGLAEFFTLLWTERAHGREAAMSELQALMQPLSVAEPAFEPGSTVVGQPLVAATSELYFRRKAAAVWWMLRGIVGNEALQEALQSWRMRPVSHEAAEKQALEFEALLEKSGKKNAANPITLRWFFEDWVLHDRGLPDLSITDVTPRQLPAGQGHNTGWLVSVSVRNDGAAAVEVPVTIRSNTFSTTSRLRIAGFASATARVIVEAAPSEVLVNDGSTPEVRVPLHKMAINIQKQQ